MKRSSPFLLRIIFAASAVLVVTTKMTTTLPSSVVSVTTAFHQPLFTYRLKQQQQQQQPYKYYNPTVLRLNCKDRHTQLYPIISSIDSDSRRTSHEIINTRSMIGFIASSVITMHTLSTIFIPLPATAVTTAASSSAAAPPPTLQLSSQQFEQQQTQEPSKVLQFKAPTADQPQIAFPTTSTEIRNPTYIEGLIYLQNPKVLQEYLYPTSVRNMIVSVRTVEQPNRIVAGAIIPLSRIMTISKSSSILSFQFRINSNNVILTDDDSLPSSSTSTSTSKQQKVNIWNDMLMNHDVIVQAMICSSDSNDSNDNEQSMNNKNNIKPKKRNINDVLDSCSNNNNNTPILFGQGIGKLIKLTATGTDGTVNTLDTNMDEKEQPQQRIIRAPVSIPLNIKS